MTINLRSAAIKRLGNRYLNTGSDRLRNNVSDPFVLTDAGTMRV